ncbi:MAG: DsbA family oxidoreductase, partial [Alphaproteobacteria bacterium]|nr:DsbA family oxidoreductase [Alphaproteobacteria bacterium]
LAKALAQRPDVPFDVRWRAYRLDPTIPPEGYERKAYLQAKFGDTERVKAAGETIRQLGESLGIRFAFESIERAPNTLDSHRLIRWAGTAGVQDEVVERLFSSYFEQGRDISDRSVLREIAAEAGMDAELVADLLAQDADSALVEREDTLAHQMGVTGVPTFIIANKYAASGAQEPEAFLQIIDKVLSEAAA